MCYIMPSRQLGIIHHEPVVRKVDSGYPPDSDFLNQYRTHNYKTKLELKNIELFAKVPVNMYFKISYTIRSNMEQKLWNILASFSVN
jgi:hypothetical protein